MNHQMIEWSSHVPFVLNLHITKACNMKCRFCFGGFNECHSKLSKDEWIELIHRVADETKHIPNRRINFAGGEPLLVPYLSDLILTCHQCGLDASIITNGSLLTKEFIEANKKYLSCIGISIDDLSIERNALSGRSVNGKPLSFMDYVERCQWVKEAGIKLKVNTVINRFNASQNFSPLLEWVDVDRWKVLRMLLLENENLDAKEWLPSDELFNDFVSRHLKHRPVVENDTDIQNTYLFVSPDGMLMDNGTGELKSLVNLNEHSLAFAMDQLNFNSVTYRKRYQA